MSKIRVKNFGPIKDGFNENDGFLDIKKVTVFIGNQGSGKSTVAKLVSTCKWLEKAINRGDISKGTKLLDLKKYCAYQSIQNYFNTETSEINYVGQAFQIHHNDSLELPHVYVDKVPNTDYNVPKIMYVPAERNFLSVIKEAFDIKNLPSNLASFAEEFKRSQKELNGKTIDLPLKGFEYSYEAFADNSFVISGSQEINLLEASSGLQSSIPLYLVSKNLTALANETFDISINNMSVTQLLQRNNEVLGTINDTRWSEELKQKMIIEIYKRYYNSCFINIVEEPEQNLFPESQRHILNSLLEFANKQDANELLMTTHSPYIINYLSIAIQGKHLLDKINASPKKDELLQPLNAIVPVEACVAADDVAIYQFQDDGSICRLGNYEGIPSDKNYLNQSLAEGNQLFDALLELEEEL